MGGEMEAEAVNAEMSDSRLSWHLDNWGQWMRRGDSHHLGYPSHSVGFMNGISVSEDSDECADAELDEKYARAMDAIIDSLDDHQRVALLISQGLQSAVFTYHRITYEDALDAAYAAIRRIAKRRNIL
jgi:hypothetical protein